MEASAVHARHRQDKAVSRSVLPKLRTAEDTPRRDSIASSKTGDSGYNSDPDVSLSPLDFTLPDYGSCNSGPPMPLFITQEPTQVLESGAQLEGRRSAAPRLLLLERCRRETIIPPTKPVVTSYPFTCSWPHSERNRYNPPQIESGAQSNHQDVLHARNNVEQWMDDSISEQERLEQRKSSITSLSSTATCSTYTVTDSEEEDTIMSSTHLPTSTIKMIDIVMRKIEINLRYAAYVQCAGGRSSRASSGANESTRAGSVSLSSGTKRKGRFDEGSPGDEDADEDGANKRRRVSITNTEDSEAGPRFACPFYKHDPSRYGNRRTCPGPGWPTVHRMKEHLYRSHAQPICCPRCYQMFDADSDLSIHLRTQPCQIASPQPVEGIDRETLKALRKRSPPLKLEEDKWRDTYQLLFPDVPQQDIPSPYYDNNSPSEESRRFRRELLERIRRELFASAEQEASPVEQRLLRRVAGIIQRCETNLLNEIYNTPGVARPEAITSLPLSALPVPTSGPSGRRRSAQAALETTATSNSMVNTMPSGPPHATGLPFGLPSQFNHYLNELPDLPSTFNGVAWEDPLPLPSSSLIDWDAVFPGLGGQGLDAASTEQTPLFTTPIFS